ncbi:AbrB/MazE/SpoVT family DNA-binding domain-containing protein [uncultured Methanobrevibacter sp.]|uniref:AbrB/MazE/SpoVT family DNA-binding domain-containing protein n=1 Tax=uncultured Methanobrevibacter sp. TaxID=253161 RepID=UPI00374469D5
MFNYTSKINYANPKTNSLRVGLPKEIVKLLKVEAGDVMDWQVDVTDGEITVIAKKLE